MANGIESRGRVLATIEQLRDAINAHDIEALVSCFDSDVCSEQPAHPARAFKGSHNIRQNWTMIFAGVPDIGAEIVRTTVSDRTAWVEWCWSGRRRDGDTFNMRGVTVQEIDHGRISSVCLYMEPVEVAANDNPTAIRKATQGER